MAGYYQSLAQEVLQLFAELDTKSSYFAATNKLACPKRCGACCQTPSIEARGIEMLPLAVHLAARGDAEGMAETAMHAVKGPCVMFQADADAGHTKGQCRNYQFRPSLCRLFGFAAVVNRLGRREFAACRILKKEANERVLAAQLAIDDGAEVPLFAEASLQLSGLSQDQSLVALRPINEALALAIHRVLSQGVWRDLRQQAASSVAKDTSLDRTNETAAKMAGDR